MNISRTKQDKFVKQKAICGEGNRHCSGCLKNAVMSLLRNGEHTFLKKSCKYPCSFAYILVEAATVSVENERKDLKSRFLCGSLQNNFGPHKEPRHT